MPTQPVTAAAAPDHVRGEDVFLASIAGYVDTLGFVALFGLFTAHVTGNFILIGSELAGVGQGLAIKWLAFPAFIAGIVGARVLDHRMRSLGHGPRARSLYALQAVLLAGFMLAGVMASPIADADAPRTILCGLLGAAAMGVQNAHGRLTARSVVANTVMTGNVTQAVIDAFDWLVPLAAPAERDAARARLRRTLPPVAAFALGAGAGAAAYVFAAFWALALPLATLCFLAYRSGRPDVGPASR
ncbi:YoaK family protein [Burkholderia diffusa]|uniref:YoaK family protein n=1 Tax=Burkholderia diffusa TaxID=488732 RepID=UPI00264B238F|nr:YoaK family protein [Burkholderia diffusa]MDN7908090.1 YoaK family protein [Burkholderia diffusa]